MSNLIHQAAPPVVRSSQDTTVETLTSSIGRSVRHAKLTTSSPPIVHPALRPACRHAAFIEQLRDCVRRGEAKPPVEEVAVQIEVPQRFRPVSLCQVGLDQEVVSGLSKRFARTTRPQHARRSPHRARHRRKASARVLQARGSGVAGAARARRAPTRRTNPEGAPPQAGPMEFHSLARRQDPGAENKSPPAPSRPP